MPKKIMVVDDSLTIRRLATLALEAAGYTVAEAADGRIALENLPAFAPNLIISDVNMPNLNGIDLVKQIRNAETFVSLKSIPIVMLTTEADPEKKQEGRAAGATAWITKPFLPERILAVAEKLIGAA